MSKRQMSSILLYAYSFMIILYSFITHSSIQNGLNLNKVAFIVLFLFIIINIIIWIIYVLNTDRKFTITDIVLVVLIFIFLVGSIFGKHLIVMESLACYSMIPNCRLINFNKFIFYDFFSKLFLVVCIIILYFIGILHNSTPYINSNLYTIESANRIGGITRRYSLGFVNPNICAGTILTLLFSLLVIYFVKFKYVKLFFFKMLLLIGLIFILILLNLICNSQSVDISLSVLIILIILYFCHLKRFVQILVIPTFFITVLLALVIPLKFDGFHFFQLNYLLSGRLYIQHSIVDYAPINFFGHNLIGLYQEYNLPIDNLPLYTLLFSGIIGFAVYYLILFNLSLNSLKCKMFIFSAIFISLFVFSMVEKQSSDVDYMAFLIEPIMYKLHVDK